MTEQRPAVLITGATRGIGRALADDLGADHHVLVGGRDAALAADVAASLPSAEPWLCDLADAAALDAAAARITRLDVLVHSAGIEAMGTLEELDREQWRRAFEVNVIAVAELTRLVLGPLRAARGTVVAINSGSGLTARAGGGAYCASKFALTAFADALREEEAGRLRVISAHPGRVDTGMQERIQARVGAEYRRDDYLRADDVAAAIASTIRMPRDASVDSLRIRPDRPTAPADADEG